MKLVWKKYKLWINSAVFLLILLLAVFLFVLPLIGKIQKNSDEIQMKNIDREMNEARVAKIPEMKQMYESFQQKEGEMEVVLDSNQEVDFIKKLEVLAEETGNKIELKIEENSNDPKKSKTAASGESAQNKKDPENIKDNLPTDNYRIMQINLQGNYENFINFLHRLENLDYYVNILSFNLVKEKEEEERPSGSARVILPNSGLNAEKAPAKEFLKSTINIAVYLKK